MSMKDFDPKSQGELACCIPERPLSIITLTSWAEDLPHITVHQKKTLVFNLWVVGLFVCLFVANAPSAQTPVTHQMTAMSISREENSSETEEFKREEASSASSSSGRWFGLCTSLNDTDLASGFEQQVQHWPLSPGDGCYLPAVKVHLAGELRRKQFVCF